MHRTAFLLITAVGEGVTGLFLLLLPAVPLALLLGVPAATPETLVPARVAGSALIAIGVTSGLARRDDGSPALQGVLVGLLLYDVAVAAVLAYAGIGGHLVGILLWPTVVVHTVLAIWCARCLGRGTPR